MNKCLLHIQSGIFSFHFFINENIHTRGGQTAEFSYVVTRSRDFERYTPIQTNEGNFEEVAEFKYLETIITNRNEMHKEIKHRLNSGNAC